MCSEEVHVFSDLFLESFVVDFAQSLDHEVSSIHADFGVVVGRNGSGDVIDVTGDLREVFNNILGDVGWVNVGEPVLDLLEVSS
jgi:hypothetical protein